MDLSAGQIVADKYRIDKVLGSGGMGVVVAATHVELHQRVAIKFLREVSTEALARFQREARMIVRLKSPHVARVFDVGSLEDDTPFIVMEHLDGSDLASVILARGTLPYEEAIDYVLQATEAVAEAHALGMVHRDLKPANLFLEKGPGGKTTVKVLDFGVSKTLDTRIDVELTRGGDLTNEGVALGSPGYMSPEQMTSARDVDARSDLFSLGAMLYRLVSGSPPYKGNSVVSILAHMATQPFPPLRSVAPDVPAPLAEAIERCLVQDREGRWPNVAAFAQALLPYASRRGRLSVEQISNTLDTPLLDDETHDTHVRTNHPVAAPNARVAGPAGGVADATMPLPENDTLRRPLTPPPIATTLLATAVANASPTTANASGTSGMSHASGANATSTARAPSSGTRSSMIVMTTAAITVVAGIGLWRLTSSRNTAEPDVDPAKTVTSTTSAASADPAVPTSVTSATSVGGPSLAAPPPASASASGETTTTTPAKPKPGPRWRPHGTPPSHPAPPNDPSRPPNPSEVPEGRH